MEKGIEIFLNEMSKWMQSHNDMARWTDGEILLYQDLLFFNEQFTESKMERASRHLPLLGFNELPTNNELTTIDNIIRKAERKGVAIYVRFNKYSKRNRF